MSNAIATKKRGSTASKITKKVDNFQRIDRLQDVKDVEFDEYSHNQCDRVAAYRARLGFSGNLTPVEMGYSNPADWRKLSKVQKDLARTAKWAFYRYQVASDRELDGLLTIAREAFAL